MPLRKNDGIENAVDASTIDLNQEVTCDHWYTKPHGEGLICVQQSIDRCHDCTGVYCSLHCKEFTRWRSDAGEPLVICYWCAVDRVRAQSRAERRASRELDAELTNAILTPAPDAPESQADEN